MVCIRRPQHHMRVRAASLGKARCPQATRPSARAATQWRSDGEPRRQFSSAMSDRTFQDRPAACARRGPDDRERSCGHERPWPPVSGCQEDRSGTRRVTCPRLGPLRPGDISVTNDLQKGAGQDHHGSDLHFLVELRGFEPLTPSMRTRCATGLRYSPWTGCQRSKLRGLLAREPPVRTRVSRRRRARRRRCTGRRPGR